MAHRPLALVPVPAQATSGDDPAPGLRAGPGWFESSLDLRRGLEVRESWSGEAALRDWIDALCASQRDCGRIASPSASTAIA